MTGVVWGYREEGLCLGLGLGLGFGIWDLGLGQCLGQCMILNTEKII